MHTLFLKEHNRLCDQIVLDIPELIGKDEMIFNYTRKIVIGIMQNITYNEFLPLLIGNVIPFYSNYKEEVCSKIFTEFSTVGYRLGHSMLSSNIRKDDNPVNIILLRDIFFKPSYIQANGSERILFGATQEKMKKIDNTLIDDLRNFLFGLPTSTNMLDLASLNMQRGRDHGIPGYNTVRQAFGLNIVNNFSEVISDSSISTKLTNLYISPDYADPWIMAISENHLPGLPVGPLVQSILKEQFRNIRDGDRYYYENDKTISNIWKKYISNTKLSDIMKRNTLININLISKIKDNVFKV